MLMGLLGSMAHSYGYEINDTIYINGTLAGAYQYQDVKGVSSSADRGGGALVFQPEIGFAPTKQDEFFLKFGFAAGNGLNDKSPFVLAPWAADLEDDVRDINGRNRDYLLTAWYKHTFRLGENHTLGLTGGVIDATDYLDENAFSNDEYTQFMNEALVNAPNAFLPSYDLGAAMEWKIGDFALKGAVMRVGSNEDGNPYNFYGLQFGYTLNTRLGEGNYRVLFDHTSADFLDPTGTRKKSHGCVLLSFDQELVEIFGAWLRFGWGRKELAIPCTRIYSGGFNIGGRLWGRPQDNVGIGYARLSDGNMDIQDIQVAEIYGRFALTDYLALTLDLQWMKENHIEGEDIKGLIYGLRLVAEF